MFCKYCGKALKFIWEINDTCIDCQININNALSAKKENYNLNDILNVSKAEKMFNDLHYFRKQTELTNDIIIYYKILEPNIVDYIIFDNVNQEYEIKFSNSLQCITIGLHKAIQQQILELGWEV